MGKTLSIYNTFRTIPGGKTIFSRVLTFNVPNFSTIRRTIQMLRTGFYQVEIKDRRSIHNHLRSINAGALCTLSELTGGLAVEASIPGNLRWIPRKMTVEYVKKAKGNLISTCSFDPEIMATPANIREIFALPDKSNAAQQHLLQLRWSVRFTDRKSPPPPR